MTFQEMEIAHKLFLIPPNLVSTFMMDENHATPTGREFIAVIPSYHTVEGEDQGLNHFTMVSNYGKL